MLTRRRGRLPRGRCVAEHEALEGRHIFGARGLGRAHPYVLVERAANRFEPFGEARLGGRELKQACERAPLLVGLTRRLRGLRETFEGRGEARVVARTLASLDEKPVRVHLL